MPHEQRRAVILHFDIGDHATPFDQYAFRRLEIGDGELEERAGGKLLNIRRQSEAGAPFADDDGAAHLLNPAREDLTRRSAQPVDQNGDRAGIRIRLWKNTEFQFARAHLHRSERPLLVANFTGDGGGDAPEPARIPAQVEDHPVSVVEARDGGLELFDHRRREDVEPDVADVARSSRTVGRTVGGTVGDTFCLELGVLWREIAELRRQLTFQPLSYKTRFARLVFVIEVNELDRRARVAIDRGQNAAGHV